jgi:hypothetical protein
VLYRQLSNLLLGKGFNLYWQIQHRLRELTPLSTMSNSQTRKTDKNGSFHHLRVNWTHNFKEIIIHKARFLRDKFQLVNDYKNKILLFFIIVYGFGQKKGLSRETSLFNYGAT